MTPSIEAKEPDVNRERSSQPDDRRTSGRAAQPALQRAPSVSPAQPPPHAALARLQRTAGNQSAGVYVRTHLRAANSLQRFGWEDIKEAYHHVQDWRHRDDPKPEDLEDWSERSDEVALHTKQALEAAQTAYGHLASAAQRNGDSRALREAQEASERIEKASGYLETADKVFKTSVKTITVIQQCEEMIEAARTLSRTDLGDVNTQHQAAEAIDKLAGGFGKLGSEVLPETPAKGWFDFLGQFSSARFFAHWTEFIHDYTQRAYDMSRSD